jgi:hypothetical protein
LKNEALAGLLYDLSITLDKRNLSNALLNYNWQLAIVEREKNNDSLYKLDKVEIKFQMNMMKGENVSQNLLRMNYYEFSEIFQNLKKIDSQLHLFKN